MLLKLFGVAVILFAVCALVVAAVYKVFDVADAFIDYLAKE